MYNIRPMHEGALPISTPVLTRKPFRVSAHWSTEEVVKRRWGRRGTILSASGAIYDVAHDDGGIAAYERRELVRLDVEERPDEELKEMLAEMQAVSDAFYGPAVATGVHAFIEFTGLMNGFIGMCRSARDEGIDFTMANTHTGKALAVAVHHAAYLAEKLACIYGPALLSDKRVRDAFIGVLFGGAYTLQATDPHPPHQKEPAHA